MHARLLLLFQTLFLGRVLGQITATLVGPAWLPEADHWFSGLLPYPILLPAQILLLMFMSLVTYDAWRERGYWYVCKPITRKILRVCAVVYMGVMALRYVLSMALVPELRWTGHAVPIFFHFVLAAYIYVLSRSPAHGELSNHGRSSIR